VTGQPILPVIPSPGRPAGTPRVRPGAVRPLPMAGPAAVLSVPLDVVYGTGRIDASGRVTDQAIACALGWREGDRLTLTAEPGVVVARLDPRGMVTVPARACLAIPAAARRRCGLQAGDRVLLAAVPGQDTLAACSFAVVDRALRAHGVFPHATGGQP
jgi:bifunctional DNA-binding transcriptional regulator/antitoxin component of YhaV-PrlF toxin-antitoxin module